MRASLRSAFSLLEVVLALGIFALGVLTLVGLSGPLLSSLKEERREAELESVLAVARSYVAREAKHSPGLFSEPLERVAFLLEPLNDDGLAGWQVDTAAALAAFLDLADTSTAVRGPSLFVLDFEPLPVPANEPDRSYQALRVTLRQRPIPEPGSDVGAWLADEMANGPPRMFHLVALP